MELLLQYMRQLLPTVAVAAVCNNSFNLTGKFWVITTGKHSCTAHGNAVQINFTIRTKPANHFLTPADAVKMIVIAKTNVFAFTLSMGALIRQAYDSVLSIIKRDDWSKITGSV